LKPLLSCINVSKTYQDNNQTVDVLNGVNFTIRPSEQLAILGASGSGKSTLLHIMGGLEPASEGQVLFEQQDMAQLSERQLAQFRNQSLGFVYQFHHLLPEFTALENVAMPLRISGLKAAESEQQAQAILNKVGLAKRVTHLPSALSGGERQRVAIARALVNQPKLVLADEPTGNLDQKTGESILQLLNDLKDQLDTAFVIVTHDIQLAERMDRVVSIENGQIVNTPKSS
jgi:lipoprotein-releasing system ATP-binding protein